MVNFSVFNELSLPLQQHQAKQSFGIFFGLLAELKKRGLNQIRMSNDFKSYRILENTNFQKFIGQQSDKDFKTRLKSFVNNAVIEISTPIIQDDDSEQKDQQNSCEYFYHQETTEGGLACCDVWNTIAISFSADEQWDKSHITIQKEEIVDDDIIKSDKDVKHASKLDHLHNHQIFFNQIEEENKLKITQNTFWQDRSQNFPNVLVFCTEVKAQIQKLDKIIFQQVISILRDIETKRKLVTDFNLSGEGETVCNSTELKKMRTFSIDDKKIFFQNHIKSLPNGYRIYFLEKNEKIYIGYIGTHLPTKKY